MTEPMYNSLAFLFRKPLLFIQAMTLCRVHDEINGTAVEERYQPHAGGFQKVKKPLGTASRSYEQNVSLASPSAFSGSRF